MITNRTAKSLDIRGGSCSTYETSAERFAAGDSGLHPAFISMELHPSARAQTFSMKAASQPFQVARNLGPCGLEDRYSGSASPCESAQRISSQMT